MAATYLTLGGYTFTGFGVPERINGGGKHQFVEHKLIGGVRIFDAMGADDDPIQFKGRFRNADGVDAMAQAKLLDAMRAAGKPMQLYYYNVSCVVVIKRFTWSFERFFEVPYTVELEVVTSATQGNGQASTTQDGAINSDIALSATLTAGSPVAGAAASSYADVYAAYGPLLNASANGASNVDEAGVNASVMLAQAAHASDTAPDLLAGVMAGGDPASMAAFVTTQAQVQTDGAAAQLALPVQQRINLNANLPPGASVQ